MVRHKTTKKNLSQVYDILALLNSIIEMSTYSFQENFQVLVHHGIFVSSDSFGSCAFNVVLICFLHEICHVIFIIGVDDKTKSSL